MAISPFQHVLAGDSWLPVVGGVKHVKQLQDGDQVFLVKPDGTIGNSRVCSVSRMSAQVRATSLLTRIGEFLLPPDARIVTRRGYEDAAAIDAASRAGQQTRVEVVQPTDIFTPSPGAGSNKEAYQAALEALPLSRIVIPNRLDHDGNICDRVQELLGVAGAAFKRYNLERWCVFDFDIPRPSRHDSTPWDQTEAQLHALMLFTAWSLERGQIVSRILDGEVTYLQRLSGCLAASGVPFEVKWLPSYRPVEARVSLEATTPASHVPVLRSATRESDVYGVSVDSAGAVIVGLALVS